MVDDALKDHCARGAQTARRPDFEKLGVASRSQLARALTAGHAS